MRAILIFLVIIFSMSINTNAQIPTNGLIGYWTFNGDALDSSGNGHHGVLNGPDLVNDRFMIVDKAYSFDRSSDDYIQTNINDSILNNYTAAGWYYWNGTHNTHAIGTFMDTGEGWAWKAYDNKVRYSQGGIALYSTYDIVPKTWFHVTISFNDTVASIYINGIKNISETCTGGQGGDFIIGAIPKYMTTYNWDGYIDQVLIYDRALDSNEVYSIYSNDICSQIIYDTIIVYDTITIYDTITLVDSISVTDTLIIDVSIEGVSQPNNTNTIKVYPNPTKDVVYINTGEFTTMTEYTIRIINNLGSVVFENACNQQEFQVDIKEFGEIGLYYIQILDNNNLIIDTRKIILE